MVLAGLNRVTVSSRSVRLMPMNFQKNSPWGYNPLLIWAGSISSQTQQPTPISQGTPARIIQKPLLDSGHSSVYFTTPEWALKQGLPIRPHKPSGISSLTMSTLTELQPPINSSWTIRLSSPSVPVIPKAILTWPWTTASYIMKTPVVLMSWAGPTPFLSPDSAGKT